MKVISKEIHLSDGKGVSGYLKVPCNSLDILEGKVVIMIYATPDSIRISHDDSGILHWKTLTFEEFRAGIKKGFDL